GRGAAGAGPRRLGTGPAGGGLRAGAAPSARTGGRSDRGNRRRARGPLIMGVSVFVMPLRTWLAGDFRTTWGEGQETASEPRRRRSAEDAERLRDGLLTQLEPLLGRRPDWDEDGPARSATAFSVYSFSLPFLL